MLQYKIINKNFKDLNKVKELNIEAFPPEEYLDTDIIIDMSREYGFDFPAFYDDEKFVGFAAVKLHKDMAYLFLFAIEKESRGQGYGSRVIQKIKEMYPNYVQVVDFEMADKNAKNFEQRVKRKQFYLKNGYSETGHFLSYLGVDYEIMSMDKNFNFNIFKELLSELKIKGFKPEYFTNG